LGPNQKIDKNIKKVVQKIKKKNCKNQLQMNSKIQEESEELIKS